MEVVKKARGAWIIHVKGSDNGKGTDAGCSSTPRPHYNEQSDVKEKKKEE